MAAENGLDSPVTLLILSKALDIIRGVPVDVGVALNQELIE